MTELQLGLIGLGATGVLGVLIYNKLQEHKHRKLAERMMSGEHDDVLLGRGGERRRPIAEAEKPLEDEEPEIPPEYLDDYEQRREPVLGSGEFDEDGRAEVEFPDVVESADEPEIEEEDEGAQEAQETDESAETSDEPELDDEIDEEPEFEPVADVASEPKAALEPSFVAAPAAQTPATVAAAATPPPSTPQFAPEPVVPVGEVPIVLLDPRIDFIVVMELVESVPSHQILQSQRDALQRISKPVTWVGFNERQREWEVIVPEEKNAYRRLRIGLQLADRRGPLSDADFTVFVAAMQQLADELMAVADMSPSQGVIDRAMALDRFCAAVDLEIGVNLVSRGSPFTGTKIRALAEAAGMSLTGNGRFTRFDDEGKALFSLQNFESTLFTPDTIKNTTTHGLTFVLDVPRVDHGERVFFQMVDLARRAADTLQGMLVDDNRQPLTETQLDQIKREYIIKPQAGMVQYGIPAGSPQAQRLFS